MFQVNGRRMLMTIGKVCNIIYKGTSCPKRIAIIINKNNKKTFPIKDVGMSKPKKHANKIRWDPKLNKPLP